MNALTLEYAGCRYRFSGMTPSQIDVARSRFEPLLCESTLEADVEIAVEYVSDATRFMQAPQEPVERHLLIGYDDERVHVRGIGFDATLRRTPLRARMKSCVTNDRFVYPFENVFRVVVCYKLFQDGGLVLHSAGLTHEGQGFLFCGRSGAGKSTLCRLAEKQGLGILSDDLNAVVPSEGSFSLLAMPFAGDYGRVPMHCGLSSITAVLGLEKSPASRLLDCSKAEAVSRIVASTPGINCDPQLVDTLTSRASQLVAQVPFRILAFAKDSTAWKVLEDEYGNSRPQLSA